MEHTTSRTGRSSSAMTTTTVPTLSSARLTRRRQVNSDQTNADEKAKAKQEAFLQKDYELKITYLSDQFARMWNRFNYFVAIETALLGGKFLISTGALSPAL